MLNNNAQKRTNKNVFSNQTIQNNNQTVYNNYPIKHFKTKEFDINKFVTFGEKGVNETIKTSFLPKDNNRNKNNINKNKPKNISNK